MRHLVVRYFKIFIVVMLSFEARAIQWILDRKNNSSCLKCKLFMQIYRCELISMCVLLWEGVFFSLPNNCFAQYDNGAIELSRNFTFFAYAANPFQIFGTFTLTKNGNINWFRAVSTCGSRASFFTVRAYFAENGNNFF